MIKSPLIYPLFFTLFPAVSYGLRYSVLSAVLLFLVFFKERLSKPSLLLLFGVFCYSSLIDSFYVQNSLTLNASRFVILILFLNFLRLNSFHSFISVLVLMNFIVTTPFIDIDTHMLHAKDIAELYGRESGLFVSPHVLGYLGGLGFLFFMYNIMRKCVGCSVFALLYNMSFLCFSSYLLFVSQNKTLLLLALVFSVLLMLRYAGVRSFVVAIIVLLSVFFLLRSLQTEFYFLFKLYRFVETGGNSSLNARFEIWLQFIELWASSLPSLIFGVPKEVQYQVGNTFDNDYLFIMVNYGLFGVLVLFVWFAYLINLMWNQKFSVEALCVAYGVIAAFFVGILSSPQSDVIFLVSFYFLILSARKYHVKM